MTKFELGTQWKTRGGWRAVVVDKVRDGGLCVYHTRESGGSGLYDHASSGKSWYDASRDLLEPWTEPKVHEGWVNIYKDMHTSMIMTSKPVDKYPNRIACIKIKFTEGEGLDNG